MHYYKRRIYRLRTNKLTQLLFHATWVMIAFIILSGCELDDVINALEEEPNEIESVVNGDEATFTFFDIGQGDSSLIQGANGETIVIDTGRHDDDRILSLLDEENIEQIDLLVLTHPHADHIGNADRVIQTYEPKEIWMSGDVHTTKTFERVIDAALESNAAYHEPTVGETHQVGPFTFDIVNPTELTGHLNNGSIAFILTYGDVTFLYTGDAEIEAEEAMVQTGLLRKVDVLKVGHHGSNSSSHDFFLREIEPDVAIYSAETGNSYGHPHTETIERLTNIQAEIYGTDTFGTIKVHTDGKTYDIVTEK